MIRGCYHQCRVDISYEPLRCYKVKNLKLVVECLLEEDDPIKCFGFQSNSMFDPEHI